VKRIPTITEAEIGADAARAINQSIDATLAELEVLFQQDFRMTPASVKLLLLVRMVARLECLDADALSVLLMVMGNRGLWCGEDAARAAYDAAYERMLDAIDLALATPEGQA